MAESLTYILITPYSILKSRTGGIIGRLLSASDLEFVGARMLSPSDGFVDEYLDSIRESPIEQDVKAAMVEYVDKNMRRSNRLGVTNRTLLMLFRGENAVAKLGKNVVGSPIQARTSADNVRSTFGDYVVADGKLTYFEPAVLVASDERTNLRQLAILGERIERDGGVIEQIVKFKEGEKPETTLVMLKPDNFAKHSSRPGNIIDNFSKTGLYIVGAKLLHLTVAQAMEFYAPLRESFVERLAFIVESRLRERLSGAFRFDLTNEDFAGLCALLKDKNAEAEFLQIVRYMTGCSRDQVSDKSSWNEPGAHKCLALLYRGIDAVAKVRAKLGPTDPSKAEGGTIRSDYGSDLMKNAAHASDSQESSERERRIVGMAGGEPSDSRRIIGEYLASI